MGDAAAAYDPEPDRDRVFGADWRRVAARRQAARHPEPPVEKVRIPSFSLSPDQVAWLYLLLGHRAPEQAVQGEQAGAALADYLVRRLVSLPLGK